MTSARKSRHRKGGRKTAELRQHARLPIGLASRLPHAFVVDALSAISPVTRLMFGCLAVYVGEKIMFLLRDRPNEPEDNGVWLATTADHHASLRRDFPHMRSLSLFGTKETHWQVLPADAPDFEEAALRACDLVLARDPRIGKLPRERGRSSRPRARARQPKRGVV